MTTDKLGRRLLNYWPVGVLAAVLGWAIFVFLNRTPNGIRGVDHFGEFGDAMAPAAAMMAALALFLQQRELRHQREELQQQRASTERVANAQEKATAEQEQLRLVMQEEAKLRLVEHGIDRLRREEARLRAVVQTAEEGVAAATGIVSNKERGLSSRGLSDSGAKALRTSTDLVRQDIANARTALAAARVALRDADQSEPLTRLDDLAPIDPVTQTRQFAEHMRNMRRAADDCCKACDTLEGRLFMLNLVVAETTDLRSPEA